ncbi:MAG: DUF4893 domain-containing protein [Parvibaculum sp.]|nr:DUF4893 domain-containing protein [Parvibaculum sp.]
MRFTAVLAAALALALPVPAFADAAPSSGWEDKITDFDRDRLARLDEAVAKGMEMAAAEPFPAGDYADLVNIMQAEAVSVTDASLRGNWRCRTIKAGGPYLSFVVYGWFSCRITARDDGLFFEKLSGSQRQTGYLYPRDATSWVLLAAPNQDHSGAPRPYSGPEGGITDPQLQDEPGILEPLADGRLRIFFPWPVLESTFNVLELKRH